MKNRSVILRAALAAASWLVIASAAQAQPAAFPTRPVSLIVPWGAGGTADVVARVLAERMSGDLGQPVLVENRPGANGTIGAQAVARAKPDGHTLLSISTTHTIVPTLLKEAPPYDILRDFALVFGTTEVPQVVIVNGKSNIRSMADLQALGKATAGGINYGSSGSGTLSHLTSVRLLQDLKLEGTHAPYKGLGPLTQAVLGNQIVFATVNVSEVVELAKAGNLRVLGVTSEQRLPSLPDVPTLSEQGLVKDLVATSWTAYVAPANTPAAVVDRLQAAFVKAAADPGVQERVGKLGVQIKSKSRAELAGHLQDQTERWRRLIEQNQIKADN